MSSTDTKITQRISANAEATRSKFFIRHKNLISFAIKVTAKGKATFIIKTRIKGKTSAVRYSIGYVNNYTVKDFREDAY